jgi:hypothetical protein
VFVTTSFEKTIRNKTKSAIEKRGYYTAMDFHFPNGPTQIHDSAIKTENERIDQCETTVTDDGQIVATTESLKLNPEATAKIRGKATQ